LRAVDRGDEGPAEVAYALGRSLGNAVTRNRVRRRLRAAVQRHEADLRPGGAYLFSAGRSAVTMPFQELAANVGELVRADSRAQR
jgi:ribonuclease P protein component